MSNAPPLVGRGGEVSLLTALLDGAKTGGGTLVLRGEPGVGKSRLLAEATTLARDRGFTLLSASGVQSEAHLAYAGLHQLLRPVRSNAQQLPEIQRGFLEVAFGLRDGPAPELFRVAMAALDLLCEVATTAPLLLVVDDVQWLDRTSCEALAFIARRLQSDPVVLLAGARAGYPSPLVDVGLPELDVSGLAPGAARELLDSVAPELAPALRDALLEEAGGNPLALTELPVSVADGTSLSLTDRLERAFAARVWELDDDARLLVQVAALSREGAAGEVVDAASRIAGRPVPLDALESAVRSAILVLDGDAVRFRHPLIRSAVRQRTGLADSRRIHDELAEVLRDVPDRRVWHRAALIVGPREDVAEELEEAGARAERRGALDVALTALLRAVELSAPAQRPRRMFAAAELAYQRGRSDLVAKLLTELERLELVPLARARARYLGELLDVRAYADHARVAALIATAEEAGAAGERDLHHNLLWITAARTWWSSRPGPDTRRIVVDAANRAGAPTAGDPRLVSIHAYADPLVNAGRVADCLHAAAAGDPGSAEAAGYLGSAGIVTGAFHEALAFFIAAAERARSEGRLGALPHLLATQAILAARLPNWDIAIPAADEARQLATELDQPIRVATAETAVALIAAVRGDPAITEQSTARVEQLAGPLGASHLVALAQSGPVLSALAQGQYDEALRVADRLFDRGDPAHHLQFACMSIGDLAEAAAYAGRADIGLERLSRVERMVGERPSEWVAINLRHARALLAVDGVEAGARFDEALGADLTGWPFWRARLLLGHGRWLRRQRRVAESRAPLRTARDLFDGMGATPWGDQARSELRASGESSRRRDRAARDDLTAQELQIAQLAAAGLSNREIGQRLYLSHRTISTHLYRVFPKLGITARGELAAALGGDT
ncbi:MAG TPA: AAA family ATPase [Sporichthyaceae bacterium]|nr:AAA family ATPase [Sporichthyaceae bacterium]